MIEATQERADEWAEQNPRIMRFSSSTPEDRLRKFIIAHVPSAYDETEMQLSDQRIAVRIDEIGAEDIIEIVGTIIRYKEIVFTFSTFDAVLSPIPYTDDDEAVLLAVFTPFTPRT